MKIDDIAKQLANKINQEHYIKHYLEKIQRGAYNKGVKDTQAEQLILSGVSHRRKLLTDYEKYCNESIYNDLKKEIDLMIKNFLKVNCG